MDDINKNDILGYQNELVTLDIDKQLWLAKQKELSEYEILKRRKRRKAYWIRNKILILFLIITILVLGNWEGIEKWANPKIELLKQYWTSVTTENVWK